MHILYRFAFFTALCLRGAQCAPTETIIRIAACEAASVQDASRPTRTESGYPYQFYQKFGSSFDNFHFPACSGADTNAVTAQLKTAPSCDQLPQLNYNFGTPDLVSVSAGGDNSAIFDSVILACIASLQNTSSTNPLYLQTCNTTLTAASHTITILPPKLESLYHAAKTHNLLPAQNRSVYALSYAQFYNTTTTKPATCAHWYDIPVPPTHIASRINALVRNINDVIQKAAIAQGVHYVDIDASFDGHRICDVPDDENVSVVEFQKNGVQFSRKGGSYAPFHPTKEGYEGMMGAFARAVRWA